MTKERCFWSPLRACEALLTSEPPGPLRGQCVLRDGSRVWAWPWGPWWHCLGSAVAPGGAGVELMGGSCWPTSQDYVVLKLSECLPSICSIVESWSFCNVKYWVFIVY